MMTGKNDDAASTREDSFLTELIPQVAEHLAEQRARDFDTEASQARFLTWLTAHTKKPAASRISPTEVAAKPRRTLLEEGKVPDDDQHVTTLVGRASRGDQDAWHELVDRYAPLVYRICTQYRLSNHDIEDVGQNVWLLLVEQLGKLREPAALPGWLATTTARECLRVVTAASKAERLGTGLDDSVIFADDAAIDEELLVTERNATLRAAFAELPSRARELLSMLISDPPHSYAEIHRELGIPVGSIGPQRARSLDRLRRLLDVAALAEDEAR